MNDKRTFGREHITKEILKQIKKLPSKSSFLDWLYENYDALKVYHGCRPVDVLS